MKNILNIILNNLYRLFSFSGFLVFPCLALVCFSDNYDIFIGIFFIICTLISIYCVFFLADRMDDINATFNLLKLNLGNQNITDETINNLINDLDNKIKKMNKEIGLK